MNVTNTLLNTTIENEFGVKISTIEHLMGALFGNGIAIKGFLDREISAKLVAPALVIHKSACWISKLRF